MLRVTILGATMVVMDVSRCSMLLCSTIEAFCQYCSGGVLTGCGFGKLRMLSSAVSLIVGVEQQKLS